MRPHGTEIALGPGTEFDLVRAFAHRWGASAANLGDDAAVLPLAPGLQLVISTDTSVEGVHFSRAWLSPFEIGWRATAAALSDLAAMAAQPLGVLSAITLPESWFDDAVEIAAGIGEATAAAGTRIVGGDLSRGAELSLCISVLGSAARPLSRAGAAAGDHVYVTGRLGGARSALAAWESRTNPAPDHRERFARPHPRIREATWLAAQGANAGIDVSDGLIADVRHLAAASGVTIEVDLDRLPLARAVTPETAAASGEEYEVVVSAPRELDAAEFKARFQLDLTRIGQVMENRGEAQVLVLHRGSRVDPPRGHDHFSR